MLLRRHGGPEAPQVSGAPGPSRRGHLLGGEGCAAPGDPAPGALVILGHTSVHPVGAPVNGAARTGPGAGSRSRPSAAGSRRPDPTVGPSSRASQQGDGDAAASLAAPPSPQSDLPGIVFLEAPDVALAIPPVDEADTFIMHRRNRRLHRPDPHESSKDPLLFKARCGWPYGVRSHFRISAEPPDPRRCKRCFRPPAHEAPSPTEEVESPSADSEHSSSQESSSGSGESDD